LKRQASAVAKQYRFADSFISRFLSLLDLAFDFRISEFVGGATHVLFLALPHEAYPVRVSYPVIPTIKPAIKAIVDVGGLRDFLIPAQNLLRRSMAETPHSSEWQNINEHGQ